MLSKVSGTPLPCGDSIIPAYRNKQQTKMDKLTSIAEASSGEEDNSSVSTSSDNEVYSDVTSSEDEDDEEANEGDCVSKNGMHWRRVEVEAGGRLPMQNIFRAKSGPTNYCRNLEEPIDAIRLFLDEGLLRYIRDRTCEYASLTGNKDFSLSLEDLEAFIGLLYIRGSMNNANFPYDLLWSQEFGSEKFKSVMARNRFREIKKNLRFDERATRSSRLEEDKYALMSWVHYRLVANFQKAYVPNENLTADEQLYPTKVRCRFLQYMANKPDKFGVKNWLLVEVDSKYCLNIIPYLGKDDKRPPMTSLGEHVIMTLIEPYLGKGYNVCTDNFFTSYPLAKNLAEKSTSIVGTLRANKREIPAVAHSQMEQYDSKFFQREEVNLVSYQAKKNKKVFLLSTLHRK